MPEPLNILCPTYWYPEHATDIHATYVHDINRHLVFLGHRVRVVTPRTEGSADREEFDGVEVVRFHIELPEDLTYGRVAQSQVGVRGKVQRLLTMATYLHRQYAANIREARDFRAHILHGHWAIPSGPTIVAAGRRLSVPTVITLHGGGVYVNREQGYDFPARWYVKPILRWTLRNAGALTAISDDCRTHAMNAGADPEDIRTIMNGADLRRFSPGRDDGLRNRYGDQMVFACRQLIPRKGIRFLIRAAARLRRDFPELQVVLAGDGFEKESLIELAREVGLEDATHFLGWVPNHELPKYYRAARVVVVPSLEEGFGIPAAEAMGCNIPVVATDAGGLPEVVENGVTGYIVPKGEIEPLAEAIAKLLSDVNLCHRMGKAGRERALARFDWCRTVEQMDDMYRSLLDARNGRGHA